MHLIKINRSYINLDKVFVTNTDDTHFNFISEGSHGGRELSVRVTEEQARKLRGYLERLCKITI